MATYCNAETALEQYNRDLATWEWQIREKQKPAKKNRRSRLNVRAVSYTHLDVYKRQIHPFNDGNGRMSRLLTTLLLYRSGFYVGKYISLEAKIAKNKDLYYEALGQAQSGWHEGAEDVVPSVSYTHLDVYKRQLVILPT